MLLFHWLSDAGESTRFFDNEPAFSIIFRPSKGSAKGETILWLDEGVLQPGAVIQGGLTTGVSCRRIGLAQNTNAFFAMPPYPNPFKRLTHIACFMPVAGEIRLEVYGSNGRSVLQEQHKVEQGLSFLTIDAEKLAAPGVYFYRLQTA